MASVWGELKRRNVVRVAVAYAIIAWLILQVGDILAPALRLPDWVNTVLAFFLILGFPMALFFAWAFELTPEGLKKEKDVDRSRSITHFTGRKLDFVIIGLLIVTSTYFAYDKFVLDLGPDEKKRSGVQSIAVLPFVNISDDPDNEYFSDGISEELLNLLVKVQGLRVASRTSSFSFKEKDHSVPEIANELNVNHVLEGSVRKAGNTIRVTAQLVDVRTDSHLWSETFDRQLEDIFAIQDEISGQIVEALEVVLGAGEREAIARAKEPTDNLDAYELFLRGRFYWQQRSGESIRQAIKLFEDATRLDPRFARAWSSLAAAHTVLPAYSDAIEDMQYPVAVSTAQKALMLDDSLAEAHAVLGDMARVDRKWEEAEAYYLRAIASEPKNSTAHLWYGEYFVMMGRLGDARKEFQIAYQLDPLLPATNKNMAAINYLLNDTRNALKYGETAWELGHPRGLLVQTMVYVDIGEFDRAIGPAEQWDNLQSLPALKSFVEAKMDAEKIPSFLDMLAQQETMLSLNFLLMAYTGIGQVDDAFRLVNSNLVPERFGYLWVIWRPNMAAFRQDPRFADLVTELGLLDYWRGNGWPDACQPVGNSVNCE